MNTKHDIQVSYTKDRTGKKISTCRTLEIALAHLLGLPKGQVKAFKGTNNIHIVTVIKGELHHFVIHAYYISVHEDQLEDIVEQIRNFF